MLEKKFTAVHILDEEKENLSDQIRALKNSVYMNTYKPNFIC